jgi:hypothetical protein
MLSLNDTSHSMLFWVVTQVGDAQMAHVHADFQLLPLATELLVYANAILPHNNTGFVKMSALSSQFALPCC